MENPLGKGRYVVLHIGNGPSRFEGKSLPRMVVTDSDPRFHLTDDIWIERLDEQLAKKHSNRL
jgi:hypothetical protein